MTPNEFVENGKPFFLEDGYSTCRSFFNSQREQLSRRDVASKAAQVLLHYLKEEGHLRTINEREQKQITTDIVSFVAVHSDPFNWKVEDEDFVEKLTDLYLQFQNVCKFEQKNQLLIITRIISVIYGCCPAFTPQLLAILNLPLKTNDVLQCLTKYKESYLTALIWIATSYLQGDPNTHPFLKHLADEAQYEVYIRLTEKREEEHQTIIFSDQSLKV